MKKLLITYGPWLLLVAIWNFGFPHAAPIADVAAAVVLACFSAAYIRKLK